MKKIVTKTRIVVAVAAIAALAGCATDGRPSLLANPDPNLRKTSAELAADAAKRSFEASAPIGGAADARADYDLGSHRFDVVNLSNQDWSNVEVWVNRQYVVYLPAMQKSVDKRLDFTYFFDREGHHFDTEGGKNPVADLEIFHDGRLYLVPAQME